MHSALHPFPFSVPEPKQGSTAQNNGSDPDSSGFVDPDRKSGIQTSRQKLPRKK
jgi:hypothetical protein